jgi:hypothetical protein
MRFSLNRLALFDKTFYRMKFVQRSEQLPSHETSAQLMAHVMMPLLDDFYLIENFRRVLSDFKLHF